MRNAALVLGVIAGLGGMIVGFFSFGYVTAIATWGEIEGVAEQVEDQQMILVMSVVAPLFALLGGALARDRALWGGLLMLASSVGMYAAFGFGVFTMFPIVFAGVGGLLALAAGKPDTPKAHF